MIIKWILLIAVSGPVIAGTVFEKQPAHFFDTSGAYSKDSWSGEDKIQHFVGSFLTTGAISYLCRYRRDWNREQSISYGAWITFSLGIGKELRDSRQKRGQFSWKDLVADGCGIFAGTLLVAWW